jgi:membrane-anchored protein YejM (alkaline phosphatase superfamily)
MNFSQRNAFLNHFFFLSYLVILLVAAPYLKRTAFSEAAPAAIYVLAVYLSYGFIYLLPVILITKFAHCIPAWSKKNRDLSPAAARMVYTLAITLTAGTTILIFVDAKIFEIFGFHINGFVWNLITTPGGIESMGGGNGTRMALFSMFYGLYGPYWFDFLNTRRSPVLMDVLQQQKYQMSMYTSARFS